MSLFKPDLIQSSNPKSFAVVLANEIGGHRSVADLDGLYALKDYPAVILGDSGEGSAVGQLWYVQSEKAFYQLINYSKIGSADGWSKANISASKNTDGTDITNSTGDGTNFLTSITIAGDGSLTSTSYNIANIQASITASYDLANKAYTYTTNLGSAYDKFYTYQSTFNTSAYNTLNTNIKNTYNWASAAYTYTTNLGSAYDKFYTYQSTFNTSAYNTLNTNIKNTYNWASAAYTYTTNLGSAYDNFFTYQKTFNTTLVNEIVYTSENVQNGVVSKIGDFTSDTNNAYLAYTIGDTAYKSQLNGATSSNAGVMSAQDKTRLDAIYNGDSALASIAISSGTWTIYDASGNDVTSTIASGSVSTKNASRITLDTGYQVSWAGKYKWTNNGKQKNPESTSGSWGTTIIPVNTESSLYTNSTKYKTNSTVANQSISAAKKGLMVDGSRVVQATGTDTASTSASCSFTTLITAFGFSTSKTVTADDVLTNGFKAGNRLSSVKRITFNTAPGENQYVFYVYPATSGDISAVKMNDSDDVKNAWTKQGEITITFPVSNASIKYKVYVSTQPGAYKQGQWVDFTF